MILEEGAADGRQVVPAAWIDGCFDGSRARPVVHEWRDFPKGGYRRKWWMPDRDRPLLLALGIFGQVIAIDRARELVVAKLATWQKALDETFAYEDVRMIDAIGRELTDAAGS